MTQIASLQETFERVETFDLAEFVRKHLTGIPAHWQIEVVFQAPLWQVQHKISTAYGSLTSTDQGVHLQGTCADLDDMARYLVGLHLPFFIQQPPELREALRKLGELIIARANALPTQGV
jgi:hypothetical protein